MHRLSAGRHHPLLHQQHHPVAKRVLTVLPRRRRRRGFPFSIHAIKDTVRFLEHLAGVPIPPIPRGSS